MNQTRGYMLMDQINSKTKAYENVLDRLKNFIKEEELRPGDRLPSERVLVDQLQMSRSSIREGLRAIELLGLIETRRGEGTFLRSYQSYRTLDLLATFIFQDPNTKQDIVQAKKIIEKEATKLAYINSQHEVVEQFRLLGVDEDPMVYKHHEMFQIILNAANNELIEKMWKLMAGFVDTFQAQPYPKQFYLKLVNIFISNKFSAIEALYE